MTPTRSCWLPCAARMEVCRSPVGRFAGVLHRGRQLAVRWFAPGEIAAEWNSWNLYREIAWYGVFNAVTTTFVSVFALRLGGSDTLVGLLTSLPALINILFQVPAARLIDQQRNLRRTIMVSEVFLRIPAFLIAIVPVVFARSQAAAVVLLMAVAKIPSAVCNVAFTTMMADIIPPRDRAQVVSVRRVLLAAATTGAVLAAGRMLDIMPFPLGYQLVFALAGATSLVGVYYVGRIVIPDRVTVARPSPKAKGQRPDLRRTVQGLLRQRRYVGFVLASFLYHWGLNLAVPLYPIYRVRVLNISEGWIGVLSVVSSAVSIAGYYAWGRVARRRDWRLVLFLGALGSAFYPVLIALSRHVGSLLIMAVIAGVVSSAFNLGLLSGLLDVAPRSRRATYLAVFNTLISVTGFVSPLLGTALTGWLGIRIALTTATLLRLVGLVAYLYVLFGSLDLRAVLSSAVRSQE